MTRTPEAAAPFAFSSRNYRLPPQRIAMLRFLVEGYDGLLFLRTLEPRTAVVALSWPTGCTAAAENVLAALCVELEMLPLPVS